MTLEQYVDTGNQDTFCQWIETQTIKLGSIKGQFSNKFGIYKRSNPNERPETLASDEVYTWIPRYGDDRNAAFRNVKNEIIQIINFAVAGDFSSIDSIRTNHIMKWKIAFLYSSERLVPVFKNDVLKAIAEYQGMDIHKKETSELQHFILSNKPANQNIYQYAAELFRQFGKEEDENPSYYLIGSKYGENAHEDMFPLMDQFSVVCTGFSWGTDLSYLYREKDAEIVRELKALGEESKSVNALKQFLQLKPGDIIAVKSTGNPKAGKPFLEIIAYAVVVERDGKTYWHETENFGHCINVEFIKTGLNKTFSVGGYSRTVHTISDAETIDLLFNDYKSGESSGVRNRIKTRRRNRSAATSRNTSGQKRKGSDPYVTSGKHNLIQQYFKEHLEEIYGKDNVLLEENNVDIKVIQPDSVTFYEVKPFAWAEDCIRAALGQLMAYTHFDTTNSNKKIRVVGPYPPDKDELGFIRFLKDTLSLDFDYEHFDV
ncbi:MAG: hypothetical protein Q8T03_13505 [Bacteroidota bacterium]|nr:hypothetical protein [Bacteroidota bacterium]MDP3558383.1 hypothetical protein [Bacteroidota bacterium]